MRLRLACPPAGSALGALGGGVAVPTYQVWGRLGAADALAVIGGKAGGPCAATLFRLFAARATAAVARSRLRESDSFESYDDALGVAP